VTLSEYIYINRWWINPMLFTALWIYDSFHINWTGHHVSSGMCALNVIAYCVAAVWLIVNAVGLEHGGAAANRLNAIDSRHRRRGRGAVRAASVGDRVVVEYTAPPRDGHGRAWLWPLALNVAAYCRTCDDESRTFYINDDGAEAAAIEFAARMRERLNSSIASDEARTLAKTINRG
jgi:hypothetical protein